MWLVCKRGKCNQFSSIKTFRNVNLRISQLKQTDSEGRVEIDFDSRVKVSVLECELPCDWPGVQCCTQLHSHLSCLTLILNPGLSLCYLIKYIATILQELWAWFCNIYPVFVSRGPFEIFLSDENNKWNVYLFI